LHKIPSLHLLFSCNAMMPAATATRAHMRDAVTVTPAQR